MTIWTKLYINGKSNKKYFSFVKLNKIDNPGGITIKTDVYVIIWTKLYLNDDVAPRKRILQRPPSQNRSWKTESGKSRLAVPAQKVRVSVAHVTRNGMRLRACDQVGHFALNCSRRGCWFCRDLNQDTWEEITSLEIGIENFGSVIGRYHEIKVDNRGPRTTKIMINYHCRHPCSDGRADITPGKG